MSVEIAWKQNILVTDFHLLKSLLVVDRQYHGTRDDEIGPLQRHLESFGSIMDLVVGQYGETSQGVHVLMDAIATSKAEYKSRADGRPLSKNERSGILAAYRRRLSVGLVSKCRSQS